jgi:hypothetical protein
MFQLPLIVSHVSHHEFSTRSNAPLSDPSGVGTENCDKRSMVDTVCSVPKRYANGNTRLWSVSSLYSLPYIQVNVNRAS